MSDRDRPQIYLVTPPQVEIEGFVPLLARVLDAAPVACLRIGLATRDEQRILHVAGALRAVAHERDVPLVIETHMHLVDRLGLDGVHFSDGPRLVRKARAALGGEAIVGAFCGASRHDGMSAAEAGADYVTFGPVAASALGDGSTAETDLFAWWSEMIEVPVVAEGGLDADAIRALAPIADFIALGEEVWAMDDPAAALVAASEAFG